MSKVLIEDELRGIAQNDYMIDGHFLPEGDILNAAAAELAALRAELERADKRIDELREMLAAARKQGGAT